MVTWHFTVSSGQIALQSGNMGQRMQKTLLHATGSGVRFGPFKNFLINYPPAHRKQAQAGITLFLS
jgi:hypothetical protein